MFCLLHSCLSVAPHEAANLGGTTALLQSGHHNAHVSSLSSPPPPLWRHVRELAEAKEAAEKTGADKSSTVQTGSEKSSNARKASRGHKSAHQHGHKHAHKEHAATEDHTHSHSESHAEEESLQGAADLAKRSSKTQKRQTSEEELHRLKDLLHNAANRTHGNLTFSLSCEKPDARGYLLPLAYGQDSFSNQLIALAESVQLARSLNRVLVVPGFMQLSASSPPTDDYVDGTHTLVPASDFIDLDASMSSLGLSPWASNGKGEYMTLDAFSRKGLCPLKAEAHAFVPSWEVSPGHDPQPSQLRVTEWRVPELLYRCPPGESDCGETGFAHRRGTPLEPLMRIPPIQKASLFMHPPAELFSLSTISSPDAAPLLVTDNFFMMHTRTTPPLVQQQQQLLSNFKWSSDVSSAATSFVKAHFGSDGFVAMHWRRGFGNGWLDVRTLEQASGALRDAIKSEQEVWTRASVLDLEDAAAAVSRLSSKKDWVDGGASTRVFLAADELLSSEEVTALDADLRADFGNSTSTGAGAGANRSTSLSTLAALPVASAVGKAASTVGTGGEATSPGNQRLVFWPGLGKSLPRSVVEMAICTKAALFVKSPGTSWSFVVNAMRGKGDDEEPEPGWFTRSMGRGQGVAAKA